MCFGACIEVVGWGGRFWSFTDTNWDPNLGGLWWLNDNGFIMQYAPLQLGSHSRTDVGRATTD